jgi:hypothetical protein
MGVGLAERSAFALLFHFSEISTLSIYMNSDFKVGQRVRRIGYADVGTVTGVEENYVTVDFDGPGVKQGYFPTNSIERITEPVPSARGNDATLFHPTEHASASSCQCSKTTR